MRNCEVLAEGAAGVEGAGGSGGHKRSWLRCPRAVVGPGQATHRHPDRLEAAARPAGPGRASRRRAERSSRRGRRAGGQAARRPEICRGNKQPGPAGVTNQNLRNWEVLRPTARLAGNAIL